MSRTMHIRNHRISEVLQEMGFTKVGEEIRMRGCHDPYCFGCTCCGICRNCRDGRSGENVSHDILEIPEGVSRRFAKRFVNSAMQEFG